jgi:hypothetical protein
MHFHLGCSGPAKGFGHGSYYVGDDRYGSVGYQQDRKDPRQENQTIQNVKPDHPISLKATIAFG